MIHSGNIKERKQEEWRRNWELRAKRLKKKIDVFKQLQTTVMAAIEEHHIDWFERQEHKTAFISAFDSINLKIPVIEKEHALITAKLEKESNDRSKEKELNNTNEKCVTPITDYKSFVIDSNFIQLVSKLKMYCVENRIPEHVELMGVSWDSKTIKREAFTEGVDFEKNRIATILGLNTNKNS